MAAAAEVAAEADNASTPSPGAPAATAAHGEVSAPTEKLQLESNPAASSQGGEITGGAAAEVPSGNAEEESETVASDESDVPEDPVEAAAEAAAILQDWPPVNIWIIGKDASDGSFDDLTFDVADRSCRLDHLAEAHDSVGLVIVKEIIPLLGGAGERRVTQGLDEDEHAKLCLLLDALPVPLSDELRSVMPRPDEIIRLTSGNGYNPDSPEVPVRLWYPFDKDFHGQLLAAIDPRPNGKKKKKWLK